VQKATLKVLTTFYVRRPDVVARTTTQVIPVPERHTVPWVGCKASLAAQGKSHYSPDLVTSVCEDHVWFEDQWMVASWCDE
jgi:hypothetical protein